MKQGIYPFVAEMGEVLSPYQSTLKARLKVLELANGGSQLDIVYTLDGLEFSTQPPLGIIAQPDSTEGPTAEEVLSLPSLLTKTRYSMSRSAELDDRLTTAAIDSGAENLCHNRPQRAS